MAGYRRLGIWALLPAAALAACAQTPMGPMVQVTPGRKSFEAFQLDDSSCRQYSQGAVAGQAESANNRAIGGAVLGTLLGAGLGAAVGGGRGAGIGAAAGATLGTAGGAGASADAQGGIQAQYDNAYAQCMYSKGNRVAGLPDPEPVGRVAYGAPRRRAPVRQVSRAPAGSGAQAAAGGAGQGAAQSSWVAPVSAASNGGMKAPADAGWVKPVQAQ